MFRLGSRHTPPCTTSQHDFCLLRTKLRCRHPCDSKSCPRVASKIRSESAGSCSQSEYKTGNPFNYPWSRRWGMCLSVKKEGLTEEPCSSGRAWPQCALQLCLPLSCFFPVCMTFFRILVLPFPTAFSFISNLPLSEVQPIFRGLPRPFFSRTLTV